MIRPRLLGLLRALVRKYPLRFLFLLVVVPSMFAYGFWAFYASLDHSTLPLYSAFWLAVEGIVVIIFADTVSNGFGWRWNTQKRAVAGSILFALGLGFVGMFLVAPNLASSQSCCLAEHAQFQYFSLLHLLQVDWFAYCFGAGLAITVGTYLLHSFMQEPRRIAFKKAGFVLALIAIIVISGFGAVEFWAQFSHRPTELVAKASTFSLPPLRSDYGYERSFSWNGTGRLYGSYSSNVSVMIQVMNREQYRTWLCEIVNAPHYDLCPPSQERLANTYWLQGNSGLIDFSIPSPWITSPQPSPFYVTFHNENLTVGAEVIVSDITIGPICAGVLSLFSSC